MDAQFFAELSAASRGAISAELDHRLACDNKGVSGFDPVTEADCATERALRALIELRFPEHGIWGEDLATGRVVAAASPLYDRAVGLLSGSASIG